jgi:hypothetical protein
MENRSFQVKFLIDKNNNIQTQINSQAVSPTEAIGLLEMAKDQMMENLRSGRKNIFDIKGNL